jgi:Dyp-type peroxidase family
MNKQFGIEFPSPSQQEHILIVRANLASSDHTTIKKGLIKLCSFFESIDSGIIRLENLGRIGNRRNSSLWEYCFTSTIGFGSGFFMKLGIPPRKHPVGLKEMPSSSELGDPSPYVISQTDLIIQLASNREYVNRWVYENSFAANSNTSKRGQPRDHTYDGISEPHDITSALKNWAVITDIHFGFQRTDGRNLMGFNDGISNIHRFSKDFKDNVWISRSDKKDRTYSGGTYMVFQKIEHDIDQWNMLDVKTQEEWVGRSKYTGLLLGTLSEEEDRELFTLLSSPIDRIRKKAERKWNRLINEQRDPKARFYDNDKKRFSKIREGCPSWSHVRKANPRQDNGAPVRLLFRRGYLYSDTSSGERPNSGLLFISFQKDIINTFEAIKKEWLNNKFFPVSGSPKNPLSGQREKFDDSENEYRHRSGRFTADELINLTKDQKEALGLSEDDDFEEAVDEAKCLSRSNPLNSDINVLLCDLHSSGREGLAGPSENGVNPNGSLIATIPLGGGYYFIPPVPKGRISLIWQLFF